MASDTLRRLKVLSEHLLSSPSTASSQATASHVSNDSLKPRQTAESIPLMITYDDVLLVPKCSPVKSRRDVIVKTKLTRNIILNNPVVSANMDTVTEAEMAIALARNGGIGIIHRFLSTAEQVAVIQKVKRAESYKIEDPYTIKSTSTFAQLYELMREKGVGSILVTEDGGPHSTLVGIVTSRDIRFVKGDQTPISTFMTPRAKLIVAPREISLQAAKSILDKSRVEKLPLVDENNRLCGLITSKDILNNTERPYASLDSRGRLLVGAAVGVKQGDLERAEALVREGCDVIVIDVAHGHSHLAIEATRNLKRHLPEVQVIAGNVATSEGTRALIEAGADAVKVGVGPGSICITRIVTGCGVPQLSALIECSAEARKYGVPIVADGGIRNSGDVVKALAAGASTVMLGSMLAGTDESPGTTLLKSGKKVKIIRGMAGYGANIGKRERENMKKEDIFDVIPEGVEAVVPYRGPVAGIIKNLVGGLASGISYCGGHTIEELQRNAEFIRISPAARAESGSHDVGEI